MAQTPVGVVSAGTYDGNDTFVGPLFASMFVEIVPIVPTVTEVPFVPQLDLTQAVYFANRWLENGTPTNAYLKAAAPNVLHQMSVTQAPLVPKGAVFGAELGVTAVSGGSNHSLILQQRINDLVAGVVTSPTTVSSAAVSAAVHPEMHR